MFYAGMFGWEVKKATPARADTRYDICWLSGSDVAAIGSPLLARMPPAWTTYVWVDDVDAVAASVVKAGGSLLAERFGSLDGGRMAIVADRCGAVFGVWTPGAHRGAQRVNEPSAYSMSVLRTPYLDVTEEFYGAVLGWTTGGVRPDAVVLRRADERHGAREHPQPLLEPMEGEGDPGFRVELGPVIGNREHRRWRCAPQTSAIASTVACPVPPARGSSGQITCTVSAPRSHSRSPPNR